MSHPSVRVAGEKNKLSELIERANRGEEIVISRHHADIARLVPIGRLPRRNISEAIARMRATRKRRSASVEEILKWRSAGRR